VHVRWRAHAALGVLAAVVLADVHRTAPGNEAITLAAFVLAGLAGHLWASRDRQERAATARAAVLRSEHDAVAARAVREERLRLARELHDVTSHAVGVMVLQAAAAQTLRAAEPDRAREAVHTVQTTGSVALRELDALSGLLDAGAVGPAGLAAARPDRDLATALQSLAARIRTAGMRVSLTLEGLLPDGDDLSATAYRVVQEALTNATRHAPDSHVEVEVRSVGELLEIDVRDDGVRTAAPQPGGFGLVGLAERVRAVGGEFSAGPRPDGGFAVTAKLPITQSTEARR
jgi:signal transduction histidine kinase